MFDTSVYLIRHAQSRPASRIAESDWPLSERGHDQAEKLSWLLEPLGLARIYSSPYRRTLSTVAPFVKRTGIDLVVDVDLRERKLAESVRPDFGEIWKRSWEDFSFALPECESSYDAQRRFVGALGRILQRETHSVIGISAHGNVIALLLHELEPGYGFEDADRLGNPDVVKVDRTREGLIWDRTFELAGIDRIITPHRDTPVDW